MSLVSRVAGELRKPASLFATLITLLNLAYSMRFFPQSGLPVPPVPVDNLLLRMIIAVLLGGIVAATFGWLIAAIRCCGEGFTAVWLLLVSVLSAWTALFDVQWLLSGPPDTLVAHAALMAGTSVATLLSIYFIGWFSAQMALPRPGSTYMWQVVGFAVMYFVVALVPLFRIELYNPFG